MILIFLPAYNEASCIAQLLSKIREVADCDRRNYHVLVVNDGSDDGTLDAIRRHSASLPIRVISHRINRGLWETVRDGFEWVAINCRPEDILVRMDADDSHEPRYIPEMVSKIEDGYDVVIASRFRRGGGAKGVGTYRSLISRSANLVMKMVFPIKGVRDYSCGYRAYRVKIIQEAIRIFGNAFIDLKGVGFTCTVEKLIRLRMMGARITEIPFVLRYDQKRSPSKMLTSITTLGYMVLILKYIYPWGETGKLWKQQVKALRERGEAHQLLGPSDKRCPECVESAASIIETQQGM